MCRSAGVSGSSRSNNPVCEHGQPSKIVQVKKEGPNKVKVLQCETLNKKFLVSKKLNRFFLKYFDEISSH